MPIYQGNYVAPVWVNGQAPTVGQTELRAMSGTLVDSQVIRGNGSPTANTAGAAGQLYADTATSPWTLWRCRGGSEGSYAWEPEEAGSGNVAPEYDDTAEYDEGDYCIHDGGLWRANTDISPAEAWTVGHWTAVTAGEDLAGHVSDTANPHGVTKAQIGLGNVDDTLQYSPSNPAVKSGTAALSGTWSQSGSVYSQTVTVTGAAVTAASIVELQFSAAQLAALLDAGTAAVTVVNNAGVLTVCAFGGAPESGMTVQCTVAEAQTAGS